MSEQLQAIPVEQRTMPDVYLIDLPFEKPLSLNDRRGFWADAAAKKLWKEKTREALLEACVPPMARARLTLFYVPKVNRRHDEDNLVASMKPVADALVDAGIIADDTAEYLERVWPIYTVKDPHRIGGRIIIQVEELA